MSPEKPGNWLDRAEAKLERQLEALWHRWNFWIAILGGLVLLLLLFFWPRIFITVRSGEQGVMFRRFGSGTVTDATYGEGLHLVPPWDTLFIYDVRIQQKRVEFQVLTNDGLEVRTDVSVRYHPRIEQVGLLHKRVGPNYFDKIVRPGIVSKLRATAGGLNAEEIYSTKRAVLRRPPRTVSATSMTATWCWTSCSSSASRCPSSCSAPSRTRRRRSSWCSSTDYRLQKEAKEAERKRIEARGVRDFQDIISGGISEELLRWRGIEATLELAKSDNAKVIVVGGKDRLPSSSTPPPRGPGPARPPARPPRGPGPPGGEEGPVAADALAEPPSRLLLRLASSARPPPPRPPPPRRALPLFFHPAPAPNAPSGPESPPAITRRRTPMETRCRLLWLVAFIAAYLIYGAART